MIKNLQIPSLSWSDATGDIARRALAIAAEMDAELQAAAAGDETSKAVATQLLMTKQEDPQSAYGLTRPQDEEGN